jgi:hypothetical protein
MRSTQSPVSVYLSVAPPDGFTRWRDAEWERWLREHPWEAAERLCSRGDWAIFLYQLRQHCARAGPRLETLMEPLVNERPLGSQQTRDLRDILRAARDELGAKPATAAQQPQQNFASAEDLEAMISAARARLGKEPTLADIWGDLFSRIDPLLESAISKGRGIYFGNV